MLRTIALLSIAPSVLYAQARVDDGTADAAYVCPVPAPAVIAARATELGAADWDKNSLACSADLWSVLADSATNNPQLQVQALLATTAYVDHVNSLANSDLYGVHAAEYALRLDHAVKQGKALEERLAAIPVDDPTVLAARGLWKLTWPAKTSDAKTQITETRAACGLLAKAVASDPKALEGNALWILGRAFYDLPQFAGGDPVKGLALLEEAHRNTPANASLLRYSAYVLAQEREPNKAEDRLKELLAIPLPDHGRQLVADELKGGADLATRLGDADLAAKLAEKRHALLEAHPELLKRLPSTANLHGGVDPLTGKEY